MSETEIRELLLLYTKHGWNMSRVFLSAKFRGSLTNDQMTALFGNTEKTDAEFDAVWFVRNRVDGAVAWELRHLSTTPFAVCESFPETFSKTEIEDEKKNMENRMRVHAS